MHLSLRLSVSKCYQLRSTYLQHHGSALLIGSFLGIRNAKRKMQKSRGKTLFKRKNMRAIRCLLMTESRKKRRVCCVLSSERAYGCPTFAHLLFTIYSSVLSVKTKLSNRRLRENDAYCTSWKMRYIPFAIRIPSRRCMHIILCICIYLCL